MVAIGVVSAWRTKLPTFTLATLMRPEIGARDGAIAELDLQIVQQALVGLDARRAKTSAWVLALSRLMTGVALLADQIGVARDVALGAVELGLSRAIAAFGLRDLRFDRPAIEREQQLALLDMGAVAGNARR